MITHPACSTHPSTPSPCGVGKQLEQHSGVSLWQRGTGSGARERGHTLPCTLAKSYWKLVTNRPQGIQE